MILCRKDIKKAMMVDDLIIDPPPQEFQYTTSALDLRIGPKFWRFKTRPEGIEHVIDFDLIRKTPQSFQELDQFIESVGLNDEGSLIFKPNGFILATTYESITLPIEGKLAARVEGRSSLARLGISVHLTAPIIHCGFSGVIFLEAKNEGPFYLKIWPNKTPLCQVVFERLSSEPRTGPLTIFIGQDKPTGKGKK